MLSVSVARDRQMKERSNQTHAEAVLLSSVPRLTMKTVREGGQRVQKLWKVVTVHDADGKAIGNRHESAGQVTVLRVDVGEVRFLEYEVAKACGYKTSDEFRGAWAAKHPRSPDAAIVWFALGDWRDRDLFMNWTGTGGHDFTRNRSRAMDADAPVLTHEQLDALSVANRQKDDARRMKASAALAEESSAGRLLRLQRVVNEMGADAARAVEQMLRQELRIIDQRLDRAEKKL